MINNDKSAVNNDKSAVSLHNEGIERTRVQHETRNMTPITGLLQFGRNHTNTRTETHTACLCKIQSD